MRSETWLRRSSSSICALAALANFAHAQSAGPLLVTENSVFALGNDAPTLSLDGSELVARETGPYTNPAPTGVHVFVRSAGAWSQQALFSVPNDIGFGLGSSRTNVSIRGTRLVIGVSNGVEAQGDARVSDFSGGSWGPLVLIPNPTDLANFGFSVLTREGLVFVGMPDTSMDFGSVELFRRVGAAWNLLGAFGPSPSGSGVYGTMMIDSGNTWLTASEDQVDVRVRGATAQIWTLQASLIPIGTPTSIAIDGDVAVVGSVQSSPLAYHFVVFERTGSTWTQTATLQSSDIVVGNAGGSSVGVHGDTIYLGLAGAHSNTGVVDVFQRQGGGWAQTARIFPDVPVANGHFGQTLAVDGTTLVVGASASATGATGSVYMFDITSLAQPQTYCTAKLNSLGCLPAIASTGVPSATNPNSFAIGVTNVLNNKSGLLVYSTTGAANVPFQGGTLCLATPLKRTPAQNSGGNSGPPDCSGSYSFDFNAYVQSQINPSLLPGVQVWAQFYSRDPGDPFTVGLSDAVTFTIGS
jgi:hypothetical protein